MLGATTRGFTLIEILVAISVFAVMAAVAYTGLGRMADYRQALAERADRLSELQRAVGTLERDLRQIVDRGIRGPYGDVQPALLASEARLALTRGGWANWAEARRSNLRRVRYLRDGQRLVRQGFTALDRVPGSQPRERELLQRVENLALRFLDEGGDWHRRWPPPTAGASDTGLPRAVEVELQLADWGRVHRLVELPDSGAGG